ncbi:MAG: 3-hydroxyacyl-CoA dehydrogenase NAD-binding domain-containing protein, partial [Planctomycetota bacterium]
MSNHNVSRVGVVGSGQMGGGITQIAAVAGFDAVVFDTSSGALERCKATHHKLLARSVEKGRMEQADADAALERIGYAESLSALADCDIIVEAVVEDAGVKKTVFAELDKTAKPGAILASNTSSISITEIAARTKRADKVIGMHFMNP